MDFRPDAVGAVAAAAAGFGLGMSLIVAIGAQNAFVLRQGLRRQHVGLVVSVCIALDAALIGIGVAGIATALGRQRGLLDALALAGAAVLAVYGAQAARRALGTQALAAAAEGPSQTRCQVLLQTLAISLLNPHVYLDTVLLMGAVGAQQPAGLRLPFVLGGAAASAVWFVLLGYAARWLTPMFARPTAWRVLDALVALTMGLLATGLALPVLERAFAVEGAGRLAAVNCVLAGSESATTSPSLP
jgi:L-lysine exporter family protein LysE/ArgO